MITRKTGQFFGETRRQETASGLILSENRYLPDQATPRHSHEAALFYLVLNGVCSEKINEGTNTHDASTLVFLPAGQAHATHWSAGDGGGLFHLEIPPSFYALRLGADDCLLQSGALHISAGLLPFLMRKLHAEFSRWDAHSPLIIEGMVLELMGQMRRTAFADTSAQTSRWLLLVEARLREQIHLLPTLGELSDLAGGVHPSHLVRAFHTRYHATPGEFVRRLRIEEAARRLQKEPDFALSTLALELGFVDQSHFSRTFRRIMGATPGQYRQMHRRK